MRVTVPAQKKQPVIAAIKAGLATSSASSTKGTYYHSSDEQSLAVKRVIAGLYSFDKSLPLLIACTVDARDSFRQMVLIHELKAGSTAGSIEFLNDSEIWYKNQTSVIRNIINQMPVSYTLRMFIDLISLRVTNSRTKGLMKEFIFNLNDYMTAKYANKLKKIYTHIYGPKKVSKILFSIDEMLEQPLIVPTILSDEFGEDFRLQSYKMHYVFRRGLNYPDLDSISILTAIQKAKQALTTEVFWSNANLIEKSIVSGIIATVDNPLFKSFFDSTGKLKEDIKKKLETTTKQSNDQLVRATKRRSDLGLKATKRSSGVSTSALMHTELESGKTLKALGERVKEDAKKLPFQYSNIGLIVDRSLSTEGGSESKNATKASIEYFHKVFLEKYPECFVEVTDDRNTNLVSPLARLVPKFESLEAVVVLSDGYENSPYEGAIGDLVAVLEAEGISVPIIHINPMVSSEMKAGARKLMDGCATFAATKVEQLSTQYNANLLELDVESYLRNQYLPLLTEPQIQQEEEIIL